MGDEPATGPEIVIHWIGGNCPVQAEGTINGEPFYFRARGEHWSLGIGGADPCGEPIWEHEEWFGEWPDAGWMTQDEAKTFLRKAAARYAGEQPGARLDDAPERVASGLARWRDGASAPSPTAPAVPLAHE